MEHSSEAQGGTPAPGPEGWGYEFKDPEDQVIGGLARWVGIFAWFCLIAGGLMALGGLLTLPHGLLNVIGGAVYLFIGAWLRGAAGSLRSVVTTEGDDIAHLMSALDSLRSAFMAMVVLIGVGILLSTLVAILVVGQA
jgi:hypothetical protein